jgi:hypothetical protein
MILNILMNFTVANINDPSLAKDYVSPRSMIEENCFKAIKYSLEIPVIPIRKFLILFYIFMRLLFG